MYFGGAFPTPLTMKTLAVKGDDPASEIAIPPVVGALTGDVGFIVSLRPDLKPRAKPNGVEEVEVAHNLCSACPAPDLPVGA